MTARTQFLFLSTGLLVFIVYVLTLAPTITWRNDGVDSGDLATAVAVGGVPHPSGYPTYLLLGEVFKLIPIGDIAYRLNLLSATSAALTVAILTLIIYHTLLNTTGRQTRNRGFTQRHNLILSCAASASLILAFSNLFWSQATIAEVYALNALFAVLLFYGALHIKPTNQHWLLPGLCSLLGLSLGNHASILLWLALPIWILKARWRWRLVVAALLAFCVGLSSYLIIPIRAANLPPVNWGLAITWSNFLWLVSAEPYRQFLFAVPWSLAPTRVLAELRLLAEAFMWWGIPVGILGLLTLFQNNRTLAHGSLISFILFSTYSIGYNTSDSYVYLLPALLIFSLWIGWGLHELGYLLSKLTIYEFHWSKFMNWGVMCLPLIPLLWNFSGQNLSQDDEAIHFAHQTLQHVPYKAVIITEDDARTFALWYTRYGLEFRSDIAIINANLLPYLWYQQSLHHTHPYLRLTNNPKEPPTSLKALVEQNISNLPIYFAMDQPPSLDGYHLQPLYQLQRVVELESD